MFVLSISSTEVRTRGEAGRDIALQFEIDRRDCMQGSTRRPAITVFISFAATPPLSNEPVDGPLLYLGLTEAGRSKIG